MLGQIHQRRLPYFGFAPGLNLGHALQCVIHSAFVCQQAVADLKLLAGLWRNDRYQVQRTLIAAVVGKTGARFKARDIALPLGVGVLPQRKYRQLPGIEADGDTEAASLVMQHGQGFAFGVGVRYDVVNGFVIVLGRPAIGLPVRQLGFGLVVEGRDLFHRCCEPRALLEEWRAEIAVVQRLVFLRIIAVIGQRIVKGKTGAAGLSDKLGHHRKIDFLERLLFQFAAQADGIGWFFIDVQRDAAGWGIGSAAVQGQQLTIVHAGMADPFVTAAGHQFIEAFQPAQTSAPIEFDEGRVDHVLDRRIPTHAYIADGGLQDIHATGWHHREFHRAVIDIDDADTFLSPTVQGVQAYGERFAGFHTELLTGDRPVLRRFAGVEEYVIPCHGLGSSGQCAKEIGRAHV